jgi:putative DNA primase/helicase
MPTPGVVKAGMLRFARDCDSPYAAIDRSIEEPSFLPAGIMGECIVQLGPQPMTTFASAPQPLGINDLLAMRIPPRQMVLDPILPAAGSAMVYAQPGGGKTYLALSVALAVATGTSLLQGRWVAPKRRRVLHVDGEMSLPDLQDRLARLKAGMTVDVDNDYFRVRAAHHSPIPNLSTEEGQRAIERHLDGIELLVLDNYSSLCWSGGGNDAGSWTPMQEWLLRLRRSGISILLMHHAGKGGEQLGTSRKEFSLDTVIDLQQPEGYQPSNGARFVVDYKKNRGFFGDAANPFEVSLGPTPDGRGLIWSTADLIPTQSDHALALFRQGLTVREVALQTGMTKSAAGRLRKKAEKEGRLDLAAGGSENEKDTIH